MPSQWNYKQGKATHGPISALELKQKMLDRELSPQSLAWREGEKEGVPAYQVRGLFHRKLDTSEETELALLEGRDGKQRIFIYITDRRVVVVPLCKPSKLVYIPAMAWIFLIGFVAGLRGEPLAGLPPAMFGGGFLAFLGMMANVFFIRAFKLPGARKLARETNFARLHNVFPGTESFYQNQIRAVYMKKKVSLVVEFHCCETERLGVLTGVIGQQYLTKDEETVKAALQKLMEDPQATNAGRRQ